MDRREHVGSLGEILNRQFKEQRLVRLARIHQVLDFGVIRFAVCDGVVKDRGFEVRPVTDNSSM